MLKFLRLFGVNNELLKRNGWTNITSKASVRTETHDFGRERIYRSGTRRKWGKSHGTYRGFFMPAICYDLQGDFLYDQDLDF